MEMFLPAGVLLVPTRSLASAKEGRLPAHTRLQVWARGKRKASPGLKLERIDDRRGGMGDMEEIYQHRYKFTVKEYFQAEYNDHIQLVTTSLTYDVFLVLGSSEYGGPVHG